MHMQALSRFDRRTATWLPAYIHCYIVRLAASFPLSAHRVFQHHACMRHDATATHPGPRGPIVKSDCLFHSQTPRSADLHDKIQAGTLCAIRTVDHLQKHSFCGGAHAGDSTQSAGRWWCSSWARPPDAPHPPLGACTAARPTASPCMPQLT